MQIFTVGGAVRDELLGLPVQDRDYVIVGASPEEMITRGFKPVGKDFPVFLHPQTHEEYALARTERKSGQGYQGFTFFTSPTVSLTEDLARRDLTINAIARDSDGTLHDPFNGQADLNARLLRHVSPAFSEDPVRILRVARFYARFSDFTIAPETRSLMQAMVLKGETDHLVAERVWQEMARGLMEKKPSRLITALRDCGALARLLPELEQLFGVPQRADYHPEIDTGLHTLMALDYAAQCGYDLAVRWAVLLHDLGKAQTPANILPHHYGHEERSAHLAENVCARLKVPSECRDLALLVARYHGIIAHCAELRPKTLITLLKNIDALRRPARFQQILKACACDFYGRAGSQSKTYTPPMHLLRALEALLAIDEAAIARACQRPSQIAETLHKARIAALKAIA